MYRFGAQFIQLFVVLYKTLETVFKKGNLSVFFFNLVSHVGRGSSQYLEKGINEKGLKLINMLLLSHALKLTWVKRIIENSGNLKTIFPLKLNVVNKKSCFELVIDQSFVVFTMKHFKQLLVKCFWYMGQI